VGVVFSPPGWGGGGVFVFLGRSRASVFSSTIVVCLMDLHR